MLLIIIIWKNREGTKEKQLHTSEKAPLNLGMVVTTAHTAYKRASKTF